MTHSSQLQGVCEYFMINQMPLVVETEGFKQLPPDIKEELVKGRSTSPIPLIDSERNCSLQ